MSNDELGLPDQSVWAIRHTENGKIILPCCPIDVICAALEDKSQASRFRPAKAAEPINTNGSQINRLLHKRAMRANAVQTIYQPSYQDNHAEMAAGASDQKQKKPFQSALTDYLDHPKLHFHRLWGLLELLSPVYFLQNYPSSQAAPWITFLPEQFSLNRLRLTLSQSQHFVQRFVRAMAAARIGFHSGWHQ